MTVNSVFNTLTQIISLFLINFNRRGTLKENKDGYKTNYTEIV